MKETRKIKTLLCCEYEVMLRVKTTHIGRDKCNIFIRITTLTLSHPARIAQLMMRPSIDCVENVYMILRSKCHQCIESQQLAKLKEATFCLILSKVLHFCV